MRNPRLLVSLTAIAILILPTQHTLAYIDPAAGSYVLQMVIGSTLAGIYLVSSYWNNLVAKLRGDRTSKQNKLTDNAHE